MPKVSRVGDGWLRTITVYIGQWSTMLVLGVLLGGLLPDPPRAYGATFTVNSTASTGDAIPGDGLCDDGTGACTLPAAVGEAASVPTCQELVAIHFSVSGQIDAGIAYHFAAGSACTNPSLSIIGPGADSLVVGGDVSASGYTYQPPDPCPPNCQVDTFIALQGLHVSGELHFNDAAASLADVIADGPIEAEVASLSITGSSVGSVSNLGGGPQPHRPYGDITVADSTTLAISGYNTVGVSLARVRVSGGLSVRAELGMPAGAHVEDSIIEDSPGVGVSVAGDVGLVRSTIRNNHGAGVVALYNAAAFPSISIVASTVSGNSGIGVATGYGGRMSIARSTIARNGGGGIGTSPPGASMSISDSIVADNTDGRGEALDCAGEAYPGSTTAIRSLIGSTGGCSITPDGNLIGVDPLLGPLADNGGLTPTHALLAGSPAIDAAGACTGTDQRGVPRPQGEACDIGAFEFACGNGTIDLGEQCDDGPDREGDCCSANCQLLPANSSCASDGEPCTADVCDGLGACTHGFPLSPGCQAPSPRGAALAINDSSLDRSDKITWKWKGLTGLGDFGNPGAASDLTLCVADAAGTLKLSATLPAGGMCAGKNCWRATKSGHAYADADLTPNGIRSASLRANASGVGTIRIKGKGDHLALGGLPLSLPARVRLLRSDAPICWESTFTTATRNDAAVFRAKAQ